ncbi:hypothetical protein OTB20_30125 [Streptomyces sp. H27-H1]|uniref:hypothetical protein n=1 Tax=Streptomyces sp. H27-H1 TaxID=2996461 RepID=UPI00226DD982|nr:hypothetical protein [Streptomyces sp. H27-H1]MCY0930373.1 hypothetical protein [Streptomyces sp. H27-H1]
MDIQGRVVALLDATGSFFEPARTAFPGASAAAWGRAARTERGSGGPGPGGPGVGLVTGDVLVHAVQRADPAVPYSPERDRAAARASREVLALAVRRRALLAAAHLTQTFVEPPGPGA